MRSIGRSTRRLLSLLNNTAPQPSATITNSERNRFSAAPKREFHLTSKTAVVTRHVAHCCRPQAGVSSCNTNLLDRGKKKTTTLGTNLARSLLMYRTAQNTPALSIPATNGAEATLNNSSEAYTSPDKANLLKQGAADLAGSPCKSWLYLIMLLNHADL